MATFTVDAPVSIPQRHFRSLEELIGAAFGSTREERQRIEDFFLWLRIEESSGDETFPVSKLRQKYAGLIR